MTNTNRATQLAAVTSAETLGAQEPTIGSPGPQQGAQQPKTDESQFRSRNENRAKKVWLPKQKLSRWETFCTVHRIDFKDLVENALDFYFQQYEASASLGAQAPNIKINDLKIDEEVITLPSSLNLNSGGLPGAQPSYEEQKARECLEFYSTKTGNAIKPGDRQAYEVGYKDLPGVRTLPQHVIRYGIMMSILLCKRRVNAFAYCLGQIHQAAEEGISIDIERLFERTFDVRLSGKNIQVSDPQKPGVLTPEYVAYTARLRAAAGAQQTLPGAGAELVEGEFDRGPTD